MDWWNDFVRNVGKDDLFALSDRRGQTHEELETELEDILAVLGDDKSDPILDFGCGAGLVSFALAKRGYRVVGVDRNATAIESAMQKAQSEGLMSQLEFRVDDCVNSALPDGSFSRVMCLCVTPHLLNNSDIPLVIGHLDRISRNASPAGRRVLFTGHRWGPSRIQVVNEILSAGFSTVKQEQLLHHMEEVVWFRPSDIDAMKSKFSVVDSYKNVHQRFWGRSVGFSLS